MREKGPNETVEEVQFRHFHSTTIFENIGIMDIDFFGLRVFRQSQLRRAGDCCQRPLVPRSAVRRACNPALGMTAYSCSNRAIRLMF